MVNDQQHIIQKINIDVDVRGITAARHIHDNIQALLHSVVFPQLEAMFNKMEIQQQVYRAESLSLELDFTSEEQLNEDLAPILVKKITEKIKPVITKSKTVTKNKAVTKSKVVTKRKIKGAVSNADMDHDEEETPEANGAKKEVQETFGNKSLPEKR